MNRHSGTGPVDLATVKLLTEIDLQTKGPRSVGTTEIKKSEKGLKMGLTKCSIH